MNQLRGRLFNAGEDEAGSDCLGGHCRVDRKADLTMVRGLVVYMGVGDLQRRSKNQEQYARNRDTADRGRAS